MNIQLTPEQIAVMQSHPDQPLRIEDDSVGQVVFVFSEKLAHVAIAAIEEQRQMKHFKQSIIQAKEGEFMPLAEADIEMRKRLGFPQPQ